MNTIVGFACTLGLEMGVNSGHHAGKELMDGVAPIHTEGKKQFHQNHQHKSYHTNASAKHGATGDTKDNCCNGKVVKFEQLDKSIVQPYASTSPVIFTVFIRSFFYVANLRCVKLFPSLNYFTRSYHPPIPDIRTAIQSFQI